MNYIVLPVPRALVRSISGIGTDQFKQTKKIKKEDELHIYDTYRAYLQTQEEFTLEIKIMKSKVGIISHKPC